MHNNIFGFRVFLLLAFNPPLAYTTGSVKGPAEEEPEGEKIIRHSLDVQRRTRSAAAPST